MSIVKRLGKTIIIFVALIISVTGLLTACGNNTTAYSGDSWMRLDYGAEMEARDDATLEREHIEIPEGVDSVVIDGEEYNVIRESLDEFDAYRNNILANDIDIDRKGNFCPDMSYPFDKIFNGNNYKLKGAFSPGGGLFSNIDGAVIENVIISSELTLAQNTSGIGHLFISRAKNSVIRNCVNYFAACKIQSDYCHFIANADNCEIIDCINYGDTKAPAGICSYAQNGCAFINCVNYGNINYGGISRFGDDYRPAGGIVGEVVGNINVSECKNYGDIIARERIGGILGGHDLHDLYNREEEESITNAIHYTENQIVQGCENFGNLYLRLKNPKDKEIKKPKNYFSINGNNIYGIGGIAGSISTVINFKNEGKFFGFEELESGLYIDYSGGIVGAAREVADCETKHTIPVQKGRSLNVGEQVGYFIK